jgi:hypothetical protein
MQQSDTKSVSSSLPVTNGQGLARFLVSLVCVIPTVTALYTLMFPQHADNAQQAFSSDQISTLHLAIPALEALHRAWSTRADRPKYEPFATALHAACTKIDDYYEKTTESPAYIMAMSRTVYSSHKKPNVNTILVLDPKEKMRYFKKHWSSELQEDVVNCVEEIVRYVFLVPFQCLTYISQFKERYLALSADSPTTQSTQRKTNKKLHVLLRELSDDEEMATDAGTDVPEDPNRPWLRDFRSYLDVVEQVPEGCSTIRWWGVSIFLCTSVREVDTIFQLNAQRYHPAWSSLARDYLAIMSSSVSSERAFSQGGITISKRRSCLKADIVEALQCIKCAIRWDLLFPEPAPSSVFEAEVNDDGEDVANENEGEEESDVDEMGWDDLFLEDEDEEPVAGMDTDSD